MAKSQVALLKLVTIPRLELCAAVMATSLAVLIKRELRIAINETVFHSDSATVLQWINSSRCELHTYVGTASLKYRMHRNQVKGVISPA